mmetsp:Transcript_1178/g.3290  ORF Transcript_1178/g.3290 Transcript_1178/m.3290 type:complete len:82 (+) Transcript_1178:201-446(+)
MRIFAIIMAPRKPGRPQTDDNDKSNYSAKIDFQSTWKYMETKQKRSKTMDCKQNRDKNNPHHTTLEKVSASVGHALGGKHV